MGVFHSVWCLHLNCNINYKRLVNVRLFLDFSNIYAIDIQEIVSIIPKKEKNIDKSTIYETGNLVRLNVCILTLNYQLYEKKNRQIRPARIC